MAVQAVDGAWWNESVKEVGMQAMDRTLSTDADWSQILNSGREELSSAVQVSGIKLNAAQQVLDLGCGVGRVSFPLAEAVGQVVGVDISASLIEIARNANLARNVHFEVIAGSPIQPESEAGYDIVFANEVFYYLNPSTLTGYFSDAFRLLRSGGQFVFQLNMEPIPLQTRLSWRLRSVMYYCGIRSWRGWSNSPGFTRQYHRIETVRESLDRIGFRMERIAIGRSLRQTWFVAVKP